MNKRTILLKILAIIMTMFWFILFPLIWLLQPWNNKTTFYEYWENVKDFYYEIQYK